MLNYLFRMGDGTMETAAFLLPLAMVLFLGPWVIRELQAMKAGQPVREAHGNVHAPDHTAKAGTPTMGGILLIGAALVYALLFLPLENVRVQCVLLVTVVTAFLGFLDDYAKIKRHNSVGVNGWFKIVLQAIAAAFCAMYLYCTDESVCGILVPFYGFVDIGWLFIPLAVLTIIATSNAVNLTDGLDGLASGCMIPASLVPKCSGARAFPWHVMPSLCWRRASGFCGTTAILRASSWGIRVRWHWEEHWVRWRCARGRNSCSSFLPASLWQRRHP